MVRIQAEISLTDLSSGGWRDYYDSDTYWYLLPVGRGHDKIESMFRKAKVEAGSVASRRARNVVVSVLVLLLLFVAAGVIYVLLADQHPSVAAVATPAPTPTDPVIKPHAPAANAKEGAAVQTITSPVAQGSNAAITVGTNATSTCSISVVYNNVPSKDSGLMNKTADAYGIVSWSWTVEPTVPVGSWPVTVSCTYHGRSAVVQSNLVVTKP